MGMDSPLNSINLQIAPDKVQELSLMLKDRELWPRLEYLLQTARQAHLELLAKPLTAEDMSAARGVVGFIDQFIDRLKPNIAAEAEGQRKHEGRDQLNRSHQPAPEESNAGGNDYMHISPDLDGDGTFGLTDPESTH